MNSQDFPRQARILKTDDFSSVFTFRRRVYGQFLAIHYQPNQLGRARLGMVAAKKITKHSVDRNYMRRLLREVFRKQQNKLGHFDLVIRVLKTFNHHDHKAVGQEFDDLLGRLSQPDGKSIPHARNVSDHV